jgi:PGF-pre-PGF domain-containing protein
MMMRKNFLLLVMFLVIFSSVGYSVACVCGTVSSDCEQEAAVDCISTNIVIDSGATWDTAGFDLITTGTTTITNGVLNASQGGAVDLGTLFTISTDGTYSATSGQTRVGGFENSGIFIHNDGELLIDIAVNVMLTGTVDNTTFYNLTILNSIGAIYKSIVVINRLYLVESWQINGPGARTILLGNGSQSGTIEIESGQYLSFDAGSDYYIMANSSDYPGIITGDGVLFGVRSESGPNLYLSDLIFTADIDTSTVTTADVFVDSDCSFQNVTIQSVGSFTVPSTVNINFTGDFINIGNFTLDGNITSTLGVVNITQNLTLNGLLNASQATQAVFGDMDINSGGTYHAPNVSTNITVSNLTIGGIYVHNSGILDVLDTIIIGVGKYLVLENTTTVKAIENSGELNVSDDVSLIFRDISGAGFRSSSGSLNSGYHSYFRGASSGMTNKWTIDESTFSSLNLTYAWIRDGNSVGTSIDAKVNISGAIGLWSFSYSDTSAPTVDFQDPTPSDGVTDYDLSIVINVSYSDDYIDTCTLEWDGSNETFANSDSTNYWETKTLAIGSEINYKVYCSDIFGNENVTSQRTVIEWFSLMHFFGPTFDNQSVVENNSFEVNISADVVGLQEMKLDWNGTNYTHYDSDLIFMLNFDNVSALGENDTNIVDHIFQSNNITVLGSSVSIGTGKYNNGLDIGGTLYQSAVNVTDYVDDLKLQNTNFTIELWAKPDSISGVGVIIGKDLDWQINHNYNKITIYLGGIWYDGTVSEEFLSGVWTHIVLTYVNTTNETTYYINGVKDRNFTTGYVTDNGAGFYLGADSRDGAGTEFNGTIDEVRIWNRTLTDNEIEQHYYSNLNKVSLTEWNFYSNQTVSSSGNYTYEGFVTNASFDNTTLNREVNVTVQTVSTTEPDVSICHLKDCKEAVLIVSGDANNYNLYSDHYEASERTNITYTFDIDTRCYREGGSCGYPVVTNGAPSLVEMREIMWAGHSLDFDGYDHVSETDEADFIESLTNSSEAFYYNLTGTIVVTGFLPNAGNHRLTSRGDWAYNNASFIYMAVRQSGGIEFHNPDLIVPRDANSSYLEHGQNSRDLYDVYTQAQQDYNAGRNYTHVWGHAASAVYDKLYGNLTALTANTSLRNYYWSASLERAARYVFERNYAMLTEIDLSSDPKQISLNISYPDGLNTSRYGVDIYVMPLTIKMPSSSSYTYVYENNSGILTMLYSYTNGTDLYFEAIPKNYTILVSTTELQTVVKPLVNLTVDIVAVLNTTGSQTRSGFAYEVIVSGNESGAKFRNWSLSITNSSNLSYVDNFDRNISNMELSLNDRLNSERGKILYYVEDGYTNSSLLTFEGNLTNVDGETRYLSLGNVNGTISVALVDSDILNVSTSLTQNITFEIDQFVASRNYTVNTTNSSDDLLENRTILSDSSGVILFSMTVDDVASVGFYLQAVPVVPTTPDDNNNAEAQCTDRKDNDGDGLVDMNDPGCSARWDNDESDDVEIVEEKVVVDDVLVNVTKGERVEVNITSGNQTGIVTKLEIVLVENVSEAGVELVETNVAPAEVVDKVNGYKISVDTGEQKVEYVAYRYIEVEADVEIEEATLQFEVSKEWMEMQGANKEQVVLLHFVNDSWVELETNYLSGDDLLVFEAQTNSFSVFAVGIKVEGESGDSFVYLLVGLGLIVLVGFFLIDRK